MPPEPTRFGLIKSEPHVYGLDHLRRDKRTAWENIRNHQAKNTLMSFGVGDLLLFYHSNADPPAAVGVARVVSAPHPDETQFDARGDYFDPTATREKPRWFCVDVEFVEEFPKPVSLDALKADSALAGMLVTRKGNRLSVTPVEQAHFERVVAMGGGKTRVR